MECTKIAIIGTHSTGKTTLGTLLADSLKQKGKDVVYVPELARACPLPINEDTTLQAQQWILSNQIKFEETLARPDCIMICDRATLDNFAYMHRAMQGNNIEEFETMAVAHMRTYHHIFKTQKLNIDAIKDGFRSIDHVFRDEIDTLITHLLQRHNIAYTLLAATPAYATHIESILESVYAPALA